MPAAYYNYKDISRLLIKNGANLDMIENSHGTTALMVAVRRKSLDTIKLLISKGANTTIKNK